MSWLDGLRHRVRTVLRPGAYEREMEEELRHHEALRAANGDGRFGNRTYHKEEARRMTWLAWTDLVRQDLGYAWRSIRRTPAVTTMIIVTLALGIGVNAATFSVLDQIFLRNPAGVVDPDGIRRIWTRHTRTGGGPAFYSEAMAFPTYRQLAATWGDPGRMAVMTSSSNFHLGGTRAGYATQILFTSANYFPLLGVSPARGRLFTEGEARPGNPTHVVVLSDRYWKAHLGADPAIVGTRIKLDTTEYEVIGVMPPAFNGINLQATEVWAPLSALPQADTPHAGVPSIWESPRYLTFFTFVRTTDGQRMADFERAATATVREANRRTDGPRADTLAEVRTASIIQARGPETVRQDELIATRLQGVALIVLVIACANVVNLLLARAVNRKREIAIRLALGISRTRLIRLITLEAVILATLAGTAALFAAWWGGAVLRAQLIVNTDFAQPIMHGHVIWATIAVTLGCGTIAGIIPALQGSRPQLTGDLKDGAKSGVRHRSRLRNGLVVAQAAFSVMLLVGATLLVRTLRNVEGIDIGFDATRILYGNIAFEPGQQPPLAGIVATSRDVAERLRSRPGIEVVARAGLTPMKGFSFWSFYWGSDSSGSLTKQFPLTYAVSPEFFEATGLRLLRGTTFHDGYSGAAEVIVNAATARLLWPHGEAVGQCIRFQKPDAACMIVTGVVADATIGDIVQASPPQIYLPLGAALTKNMDGGLLVVRARAGGEATARREISAVLRQAYPTAEPIIGSMVDDLNPKYRPWRLGAQLFAGLGALALLVALVGIYSTIAYSVGQRRHEFGVRVALGAKVGDVLNQVVGEGVRVVLVGVALGVGLTLVASRLVATLLYGVEPNDVSAILLAGSALLLVTIVAAIVPALRAARSDPLTALRSE
ncbi:MAG TPA: ADOP family duplicated permease [Gemmatimonadaceae bacterium]|nr:ADOP family duplicated permease [Gemmatimonadaceae bacterium]